MSLFEYARTIAYLVDTRLGRNVCHYWVVMSPPGSSSVQFRVEATPYKSITLTEEEIMSTTFEETAKRLFEEFTDSIDSESAKVEPEKEKEARYDESDTDSEHLKVNPDGVEFSKLLGFLPSSGIDHKITVHDVESWPPEARALIPTANPNHVYDKHATEFALVGIEHNQRVSISGPPGCGKTTLVENLAGLTNRPFVRMNGKDGIEISSFVGSLAPDGAGGWAWQDGILPRTMKLGGVLCLDEWTKIPPGIAMVLQWVLEKGGKLVLDDKPGTIEEKTITPHPEFRIVLCDNVKGLGDNLAKSVATNVQDTSTINRFDLHITMDYLKSTDEIELLRKAYPKLTDRNAEDMVKMANLVRKSDSTGDLSLSMSPRNLLAWAKWSLYYKDPKVTYRATYHDSLASDVERSHSEQLFKTVFNENLV